MRINGQEHISLRIFTEIMSSHCRRNQVPEQVAFGHAANAHYSARFAGPQVAYDESDLRLPISQRQSLE